MSLEQQDSHESADQQQEELSWTESLGAKFKAADDYVQTVLMGHNGIEAKADYFIQNDEEFDDDNARFIADTYDIGRITEYLESGKAGELNGETLTYMNEAALSQVRTDPGDMNAGEIRDAKALFTILNQDPQIAESNINKYLQLLETVNRDTDDMFNIHQAPPYLAGIGEYLDGTAYYETTDEMYYGPPGVDDATSQKNQERFAQTFPGSPMVEPDVLAPIIDDTVKGLANENIFRADGQGYIDKALAILGRDDLPREDAARICDAFTEMGFGLRAQNPEVDENGNGLADGVEIMTRIMRAVIANPKNVPPRQYVAIVDKFYGPGTTHGFMPEDIDLKIQKRTVTLHERGKIDDAQYQELVATTGKNPVRAGRRAKSQGPIT